MDSSTLYDLGQFRPFWARKRGETAKENWTGGKFNLVMFLDMGLLSLNSIFSAPNGQK